MRRFVGNGRFCLKICYNSITEPNFCQNIFDMLGCEYNMPSNVRDGTFTKCDGELQDEFGRYVLEGVSKYHFVF